MFTQQKKRTAVRRGVAAGAATAAMLLVAGCSGGVVTENGSGGTTEPDVTLTLVTAAVQGTPNAAVQDWFLDELESRSEGRIAIERTEAYALCAAPEIADCVRDGRAQIGVTIPDYTPQYFPSTSMVSIPFIGQNWRAITNALYDLHTENENAKAIMDRNGLHYLATWPVGRVLIGTKQPVENPEQLAGLSARVSGPLAQQLFQEAGVNIVALPANEAYEGVERGLVDAVAAGMDFPVNYKLNELLPYWTDPGLGQYSAFGMWMSKDTYESLSDDLKAVVDEVAAELSSGAAAEVFNTQALEQCPQMLEATTVEDLDAWDESVTDAWRETTGDTMLEGWVALASGQGLEDAQGVLDDYLDSLEEYSDTEVNDAVLACIKDFESR